MSRTLILITCLTASGLYGQFKVLDLGLVEANCPNVCALSLTLENTPPPTASTKENWSVAIVDPKTQATNRIPLTRDPSIVTSLIGNVSVSTATLFFDKASLGSADLKKTLWRIVFDDGTALVTAEGKVILTSVTSWFRKAKDRQDSDLYFSGGALAGQGTKPIYTVDLKLNLFAPLPRQMRAGLTSEVLINPDTKPPLERSEIDPDSIKVAAALDGVKAFQGPLINGMLWQIRPVGGEFARSYPASNLTTEGRAGLSLTPVGSGVDKWLTFYPYVGYELGSNQNRPAILFKRPVDLSAYDKIRRLLVLADLNFRIYGSEKDPKVFFYSSYQGRVLFADEPFTRLEYAFKADGSPDLDATGQHKRQKTVIMGRNARHFVRNGLNWALNDFFSLNVEHRWGSLPPLFEYTRNQITVGLVLKAQLLRR